MTNEEKIKGLEKELKNLKEKLKGFENGDVAWKGDMDATIKQNLELKAQIKDIIGILKMNDYVENIYNYLCCLLNLRVVDEYDCEICGFNCKKRLEKQVEEMKNCHNCQNFRKDYNLCIYSGGDEDYFCRLRKWELKE